MAIGNPVALMAINEGAAASSIRAVSVDSTVTDAVQMSFSQTFTQIDGGAYFTCGLASDGSLWTWGTPLYGGPVVSSPQRIGSDSDWKCVSAGDLLAVGIKNDGSLWTWSYWTGPTPVKKTTSDGYNWGLTWNTVSVGSNHLVAISTSGAIYTSGDGYQGQIGDGSMTARTNATSPDGLYGTWTSVAAGQYHTAAVNSAGALYAWGANSNGQLGDMTTAQKTRPTLIGTGYKAVWCGDSFTVAQKTDGTLVATGANFDYQLGTNSYNASTSFTAVYGASTLWTNVAVGRSHVIATRSDGTMWAWGAPSLGQHGDGFIGYSLAPEQVGTATNWTGAFAAGDTSYLKRGAEILSTGKGTTGFLGDGTVLDRSTPGSMSVWEAYTQHRPMTLAAIDGTHTVTASYRDAVGSVVTLSDSIVLDVTAPSISFVINSNDTITNSRTVTLNMTYGAPANHAVAIRVDGGAWVAPTANVTATLSAGDGAKTVTVDARDIAGNIGTYSANITLDSTPPSGTMSISDGAPVTRFRNVAITSNVSGAAYVRVPTAWKSVSGGTDHLMIIKPDGALWGWGGNGSGEIGDGTTTARTLPTPIGSALWQSVCAAPNYTLGIQADGTLWAWGYNAYGQLGIGTTTAVSTPTLVQGGTWKAVSGGNYHALGVRTDGTLWGWGYNSGGPVGDGTTTQRLAPVQVGTDADWKVVAAGYFSSRGIKTDGSLWTWGNGTLVPTRVGTDANWASVSSGSSWVYGTNYTLATRTDGSLWVWGTVPSARPGALGLGVNIVSSPAPTRIGTDNDWVNATAGPESAFATKSDGSLWSWGYNPDGQLGLGTVGDSAWTPMRVGTGTNWLTIAPSGSRTYGLTTDGSLYAWGHYYYCATGTSSSMPITSPAPSGWVAYAATVPMTLSETPGLTTLTVGYRDNAGNQLDLVDSITYDPDAPVTMSINGGSARTSSTTLTVDSAVPGATQMRLGRKWKSVFASNNYTMVHSQDGPVEFAGYGTPGMAGDGTVAFMTFTPKFGGKSRVWADYAAGGKHSLAIAPNGSLWTWGSDLDGTGSDGELGLPGTTSALQPLNVTPGVVYKRVFAGLHTSFAIRDDGTLWAWGKNASGELGDGTVISRSAPVQVGVDTDWAEVSNGGGLTLALKVDGSLWAWGPNGSGQLGLGDTVQRLAPTRVGSATGWRSISAGFDHSLAVASDGSIWAWGYNGYGQLGDGTKVNKTAPVKVSSLQWKTIETGIACSFGVRQDGTLWVWGDNYSGQLGDGTTTERVSPVRIGTRTDWELVSSGGTPESPRYNWMNSSVGTTTDGRLFTWGDNTFGQLGDGTSTQRLAPVEITRSPLVAFATSASLSAPWVSGDTTIHASYSDSVGNVTWLSDTIFVTPAPPVISQLMPYQGLVVESSTPVISAHVDVSSGGMPATIEVRVDGVLFPSTYDAALTHVVRATATGLSDDATHTVEIKVTDAASTVVTATASFLLEGGTRMLHWDGKPDCRTCHGTAVPHDLSVVTTGGEPRCIICHMGVHNTRPEDPSYYGCGCHISRTHPSYYNWTHKLDPAKCRTCHAVFNAGLEPDRLETVRHNADTTACKPCHRSELRFEHVLRKTDAGVTLTCATCHATTAPAAIKAAVLANDTRCATCHPGVDHWPLHDEPPLEPACASCHKANLLDEHVYRGVLCDTCHLSTNTVVTAAIAARDGSCAACHGSAAGPNHTFGGVPPVDKTKCATCHWSAGTVGATLDSVHKHASPWLPARSQCVICHKSRFDVTTGLYGSPAFVGPYGTFASVESTTASADSIHSAHMNGSHLLGPNAGLSYCNSCHAAAACDACHTTVTHGDHTRNAITGVYGALPVTRPVAPGVLPGATVNKTVTTQAVTCIAAKCHAVSVDGTLAKKPLCSDCH